MCKTACDLPIMNLMFSLAKSFHLDWCHLFHFSLILCNWTPQKTQNKKTTNDTQGGGVWTATNQCHCFIASREVKSRFQMLQPRQLLPVKFHFLNYISLRRSVYKLLLCWEWAPVFGFFSLSLKQSRTETCSSFWCQDFNSAAWC